MLRIVLLAFGAAIFPALLACVAILLSRPDPRRLILAFYLGGLLVSIAAGIVVLGVFEGGGEVAGSTSDSPHGTVSIIVGTLGLLFAWLLVSARGRRLIDRWRSRLPQRHPRTHEGPSWVERRLDRANVRVAFVVGGAINLPGPFYLLALGDLATGYGRTEQLALILLFNAIMFMLLELPLVGYLVDPVWTGQAVSKLAGWLNSNGLRVIGGLVGFFSISLVVQGLGAAF
jgi:hypothetical protein